MNVQTIDDNYVKGAMQYAITVAKYCGEDYNIKLDQCRTELWLDALHAGYINGEPSYDVAFRLVCIIQA